MHTHRFASLLCAAAAAACAPASHIPQTLEPADASLAMVLPASGVQVYECRIGKENPLKYEWAFLAPEAELYDTHGRVVATHGAGPFWQSKDGSRVTGKVMARADAPREGSIPWLLLSATSTGAQGTFSGVTKIQRVNTRGGLQPSKACEAQTLGQQVGVHYTADYRFFVARN